MAQKNWVKILLPQTMTLGTLYSYLYGLNSPAYWAGMPCKPSKFEESLVVRNEKQLFEFWMLGFLFMFTWWEYVYAYQL